MNKKIKKLVCEHSAVTYPKECCGFFVWSINGLEVIRAENISDTPETNFKLNPADYVRATKIGKIIGIYHSHPDADPQISDEDKNVAESFCLPIYAFSYPDYAYGYYEPMSYNPPELLGRPFAENIFDCLSLIRDFHKKEYNILFPFVPYEENWMDLGKTYFEENWEKFGFVKISSPEPKDVVLFTLGGKFVCHAAILEDYNTLLHHCEEKLSCREQFDFRLVKHVYGYFRHKSLI